MPERSVTIRISAADSFSSVIQSYNRAIDSAERNTQEFSRTSNQAAGGMSALTGAMGGFIAGIGLQQIGQYAGEMLELGTNVGIANITLDALAGSEANAISLMGQLDIATGDVLNQMELMSIANAGLTLELFDSNQQMVEMTGNAVRLGAAVGSSPVEAIEALNAALKNQSFELLDTLGVKSADVRARIIELKDAGLDMNAAFTQATEEGLARGVERIGDAATAAFTPLDRITARAEDFAIAMSGDFAAGIQGFLNWVNVTTDIAEREAQIANNIAEAAGIVEERLSGSGLASAFGGEEGFFTLATDAALNFEETVGRSVETVEDLEQAIALLGRDPLMVRQFEDASMFFLDRYSTAAENALAIVQAQQRTAELWSMYGSAPDAYNLPAGFNVNDAMATGERRGSFNQLSDYITNATSNIQGVADVAYFGQGVISEEDNARLQDSASLIEDMVADMEAMSETEPINDAALQQAQAYRDMIRHAADYSQEMLDNFNNATLGERLGQTNVVAGSAMGRFDSLADMALGSTEGMTPEQIQAARDAFSLFTGEVNQLGLTVRDRVAPAIGDLLEAGQFDAAVQMTEAFREELDRLAASGASVVEMNARISGAMGAGFGQVTLGSADSFIRPTGRGPIEGGGEFDPSAAMDYLGTGADAMTMMADDSTTLRDVMGEIAPNVIDIMESMPGIESGMKGFSLYADEVKNDVAEISAGLTALVSQVQRVRVEIVPTAPGWLIGLLSGSEARAQFLGNVVNYGQNVNVERTR